MVVGDDKFLSAVEHGRSTPLSRRPQRNGRMESMHAFAAADRVSQHHVAVLQWHEQAAGKRHGLSRRSSQVER